MEQKQVLFTQISLEELGLLIKETVEKAVEKTVKNKNAPKEKEFYTRKEASDLLGVSFTTCNSHDFI